MLFTIFLTLLGVIPLCSATCSCGQRNTPTRIVGGTNAGANEFPWQVSLQDTDYEHFCGGSLISSRWVLSAAHCTYYKYASNVIVVLGKHKLNRLTAIEKYFTASSIINHPNYNTDSLDNDISLVQLPSAVTFNQQISPVCLPLEKKTNIQTDDIVTISGWGFINNNLDTTSTLQKVDIKYMDIGACKSAMGRYSWSVLDSMVCGMDQGKGACYGDSGGPLVKTIGGSYYLYGAVSWGINCNYYQYPTMYVKVVNYLDWIKTQTGAANEFCIP